MFDPDAFEQAWVNACVHNKWAVSDHPGVYIYEDRLVIESQGGREASLSLFQNGLKKEEIAKLLNLSLEDVEKYIG